MTCIMIRISSIAFLLPNVIAPGKGNKLESLSFRVWNVMPGRVELVESQVTSLESR